jgi:nucleotide-binding universal stress UspA family protein
MKEKNIMLNKILVPIDGSEHSDKALNYALDLAEKYSAEIVLLSVAQPFVATEPMYVTQPMMPPESTIVYVKGIETAHEKMLAEALEKAKEIRPSIKISKLLVDGRPADRIVEIAKEEKFDLIVMGSRGLGGIKEFFLGSVSDRVADQAPCPVLIVKKTNSSE